MKVVKVSKNDLKHNIEQIKKYLRKNKNLEEGTDDVKKIPKIIGVVKGNGYGLGLIQFSNFLIDNGIDMLAVSSVEDALELKENNVKAEVLLLGTTSLEDELENLVNNDIIISIGSFLDLENLIKVLTKNSEKKKSSESNKSNEDDKNRKNIERNKSGKKNEIIKKQKIHIKVDTGFNRYGFKIDEIERLCEYINNNEITNYVEIQGVFSHFSNAYGNNEKDTIKQFDLFIKAVKILEQNGINPELKHICNSTALFRFPEMQLNAVRVGSAFIRKSKKREALWLKKSGNFNK